MTLVGYDIPDKWRDRVSHYFAVREQCKFEVSDSDKEDWEDADRFIWRIKNDFVFFFQAIMVDRGLYTKAKIGPVDLDIIYFLGNGPRGATPEEMRRRTLLAFRGEGKTHGIAALCNYRLLRDPARECFIVSRSEREVKKTVRMARKWIGNVWFLKHLAPTAEQRDAATYFDVRGSASGSERQPSMSCIGANGQLEGNRGHTIIYDDVETKGNTKTFEAREMLRRIFAEATNICYPYLPHNQGGPVDPSEIVNVGTPKNEETIYNDLKDQGYVTYSYPIALPAPHEHVVGKLAPILQARLDAGEKPGTPTMPLRFPEYEVNLRRALGFTEFAMEFMLIADLADTNRHPIRLADLIVATVHREIAPLRIVWGRTDHNGSTRIPSSELPCYGLGDDGLHRPVYVERENWQPYSGTKAGIDPAGRGDDKTGLAIVSHLAGTFWCPFLRGFQGGFEPEKLETIAMLLREYNVRSLYYESNIDVGGTYEAIMAMAIRRLVVKPGDDTRFPNGWACQIIGTRAQGQKELRIIETLEPVISTHRLVMDPSTLVTDADRKSLDNNVQYQLSRITKDRDCLREDGMVDALTIALRAWQNELRADPDTSSDAREKRSLLDQLREMTEYFGSKRGKSVLKDPVKYPGGKR